MSKARIIEIEQQPKFKPFKLEITIESEEDLINLWLRMLVSYQKIESCYSSGISKHVPSKTNWKKSRVDADVFEKLANKAKELGLRE